MIDNFYRVSNEIKHWSAIMPGPIEVKPTDFCPTFKQIAESICALLNLEVDRVFEKDRNFQLVFARQMMHSVAYHFSNMNKSWTLESIGRNLGNKHHATVIHSIKSISEMIATGYDKATIRGVTDIFDISPSDLHYKKY